MCSSDAVDKNPPAVHTLPVAKTFSKTAAAPKNSGINPAPAFKSPTAPEQRSVHLGGQTGRRTHTGTFFCCCKRGLATFLHYLQSSQQGADLSR